MPLLASDLVETARYRAYGPRHIDEIADRYGLSADDREMIRVTSTVLPFRVNEYVLELIDWDRIPEDPIFQLVFPQHGMLCADDEHRLRRLSGDGGDRRELAACVAEIRAGLNPHPSGQRELNVPNHDGVELAGLQHKYRETVLYFPQQGQTCHAYCTYCFRWAQFVGDADLRFAAPTPDRLLDYLAVHPEVTDVLVTGGDPMVMTAERLRAHVEPLLEMDSLNTIRIGTKSVAYWPQRFVSDKDADDVLRLFEDVVASGRTLAVMAHFSHPRELSTDVARRAIARIRGTGAVVYCQAPLIAHVNDSAPVLTQLWQAELAVGAVPYYLFVERDTGPYDYFKVPLARGVEIFQAAYRNLPGLGRTVRGPVMSATPGKVVVDGVEDTALGRFFRLRFLQARDPDLVGRPFKARYSESAAWLDELELDLPTSAAVVSTAMGSQR
ncbi:lysine 2,3-aminomutase [Streptomyces sp. NBC_01239]|uniref:KamA family radical SAM protein n=1 Tax=Streptomyces sp. NBC_01239 TaxID=2903792 RepID=UPI002251B5AA|nr:lysine 2,3-aminomutase [Streptomyces sp. NBC_01239]MCX4816550.1 lysine 2,3-aminomutase [Streptomyces sp. NBC_01239]